jgi:UDP-N-acetylmuramoyl-tripeptide--D-alanyl-D-alanine ligase
MIALSVAQIAAIVGGDLADISAEDAASRYVTATVEFDSRKVTSGGLFLALPGTRADGHDHAASAVAAGAVAVLAARPVGVPAIVVAPDPHAAQRADGGLAGVLEYDTDGSGAAVLAALAKLAAAVAAELVAGGLTIVGITGSSGKTSTKDLLAAVLAPLGEVVAPPGSFNNELGHPWTVLRATAATDYLILELSARHPGNIAALAAIAPPAIGVVLNVGTAHLGEFGSREAIAKTKSELPQAIPRSGVAVLNVDDPAVAAMAEVTAARVVRVSRNSQTDVWAGPVTLDELARPQFTLHSGAAAVDVSLAVHGDQRVVRGRRRAGMRRNHHTGCRGDGRCRPGVGSPDAGQHPHRRGDGDRRRLQRQPGLDARRAAGAGLDFGRQRGRPSPQLGGAGRDGGARRRRDIRT